MKKIVCIGKQPGLGNMFCLIEYVDGKLSIHGVEGPYAGGDCRGACGQIAMHEWNFSELQPGWNPELIEKFRDVWNTWHLNDLTAGSPNQEAWIKQNKLDATYPKSHYTIYSAALTEAGLNPDSNFLHNGVPYKYGSAWLRREVPNDVLTFLESLPESTITPAWI